MEDQEAEEVVGYCGFLMLRGLESEREGPIRAYLSFSTQKRE